MKVSNCFERLRTALDPNEHKRASLDYAQMVTGKDCSKESISNYEDESFVSYGQQGLNPPLLPDDNELYKMVKEYWMQEADCYLGKSDKLPTPRGKDTDEQLQDNAPKSAPEAKNESVEPQQKTTEGTESKLPPIPTTISAEQIEENRLQNFLSVLKWQDVEIKPDEYLDFTKRYNPDSFAFEYKCRKFSRLGDVTVVSGQSGMGKTQFVSLLIAAALNSSYEGLGWAFKQDAKILLCDTEQSETDTIGVKNRILSMCERDIYVRPENIVILRQRDTENPVDRWRKILKSTYENRPNLLIIDGLIDVVKNFNELEDCQNLISQLLQTASIYKCAIITVLHTNPSNPKQEYNKLVGHLGSFLERKACDIFIVSREKDGKREIDGIYKVENYKARGHKKLDDIKFEVIDCGQWGRPHLIDSEPNTTKGLPAIEDIEKALQDNKDSILQPFTKEDLKAFFKEQLNVTNSDKLSDCVKMAENKRLIVAQKKEEYEPNQKHPKYYINI